jgi:hypothetical protein
MNLPIERETMSRSGLSRQKIYEILIARRIAMIEFYMHFTVLDPIYFRPLRKLGSKQVLDTIYSGMKSLVELVAMRLESGGTGSIITHDETRQTYLWVLRELISKLPEHEQPHLSSMAEPAVDYLMLISSFWYAHSTYEAEIEYLDAVVALSQAHMLEPVVYLREVPNAQDAIVRWVYSPESYMAWELARYDHTPPCDQLEDLFVQAIRRCEDAIHLAWGARQKEQALRAMIPEALRFWHHRALRAQRAEQRIRRIWPEVITDNALEV